MTPTSLGSELSAFLNSFGPAVAGLMAREDGDDPFSGTLSSSEELPPDWGSLLSSSIHSSFGGAGGYGLAVVSPFSGVFDS